MARKCFKCGKEIKGSEWLDAPKYKKYKFICERCIDMKKAHKINIQEDNKNE